MVSSYEQNNYGEVIHAIVKTFRPMVCVELGVLHGYSTIAIGLALKINQHRGVDCHLDAYDLFEKYEFNHGRQDQVQQKIDSLGLTDVVSLKQNDAFTVHYAYKEDSVWFLHVDLSNTGDTVRRIMNLWDPVMVVGGIILFEGGTEERDKIDWMVKYNKEPIKPEIETNPVIAEKYVYATYLKFPGLTCLLKKRS